MPLSTLIWQAHNIMHTAVVFYFSGTGNTWWVADRIIRQLDASNINATAVSMDTLSPKKADWWIKSADLVLFGWPVYTSYLPQPVNRFIDALPVLEKPKHVHVFCTQMMYSGDGAWMAHKRLKEKGLLVDTAEHFTMPSNMSMNHSFFGTPPQKAVKKILNAAEAQVQNYVKRLLEGRQRIKGRYGWLLGSVQRVPFRPFQRNAARKMGVDTVRCTGCGLCEKLCPVGNISLSQVPVFFDRCAMCLRCYAFCPVSAVTYGGRLHDVNKYGRPYTVPDIHFKSSLLVK